MRKLPSGIPRLTHSMLCTNKEQVKTIRLQLLEATVTDGTAPPLRGYRYDPEPRLLITIAYLLFQQVLLQVLSVTMIIYNKVILEQSKAILIT